MEPTKSAQSPEPRRHLFGGGSKRDATTVESASRDAHIARPFLLAPGPLSPVRSTSLRRIVQQRMSPKKDARTSSEPASPARSTAQLLSSPTRFETIASPLKRKRLPLTEHQIEMASHRPDLAGALYTGIDDNALLHDLDDERAPDASREPTPSPSPDIPVDADIDETDANEANATTETTEAAPTLAVSSTDAANIAEIAVAAKSADAVEETTAVSPSSNERKRKHSSEPAKLSVRMDSRDNLVWNADPSLTLGVFSPERAKKRAKMDDALAVRAQEFYDTVSKELGECLRFFPCQEDEETCPLDHMNLDFCNVPREEIEEALSAISELRGALQQAAAVADSLTVRAH